MSSNLWLSNATHRIFGWKELLEEWDATLQIPSQVTRVFENLQAATNPNGTHNPRLSQFLTYLNYEQEGLAWFLYECVTIRWMYDHVRVDYIRSLVDEIENLDGYFPRFPGSPQGKTMRQFVQENLGAGELADVQMMPPLQPSNYYYDTPARRVQSSPQAPRRTTSFAPFSAESQFVPPQVSRSLSQQFEALQPKKASIEIRFLRDKESSKDDVVVISQVSADSYNIAYNDHYSGVKNKVFAVTRDAVMKFLSLSLRFLTVDEEPFQSVQVTLPSMPAIMVSPKNLSSQTRDLIYDSVEATMDFWPLKA
jgi:hypothetical protein